MFKQYCAPEICLAVLPLFLLAFVFCVYSAAAQSNNPGIQSSLSEESSSRIVAFTTPRESTIDSLVILSPQQLISDILHFNNSVNAIETKAEALATRMQYVGARPDPALLIAAQPLPVYTARGKQISQVRLEQMISIGGQRRLTEDLAGLEAEMGYDDSQILAAHTILEAQLAYVEIQRQIEHRNLLRRFRDTLNQYEQIALQKYEVGAGRQQDVLKIQLERSRLAQRSMEIDRVIRIQELFLERVLEHPVIVNYVGEEPPDQPVDFSMIDSRADVLRLEKAQEQIDIRRNLLNAYDRPEVGASITWISIADANVPANSDGRDALAVGLMVRLPIGRRANKARLQELELLERHNEEKMISLRRSIDAMVRDHLERISQDEARIHHLKFSLLPEINTLLEASLASYQNGEMDFLNLLDSERMSYQIKQEHIDLASRIRASQLTLTRISGRLDAQIKSESRLGVRP